MNVQVGFPFCFSNYILRKRSLINLSPVFRCIIMQFLFPVNVNETASKNKRFL